MDWLHITLNVCFCTVCVFTSFASISSTRQDSWHLNQPTTPVKRRPRQTLDAVIDGTFAMWEVESDLTPRSHDPTLRGFMDCGSEKPVVQKLRKQMVFASEIHVANICKSFKRNSRLVIVGHFDSFVNENLRNVFIECD